MSDALPTYRPGAGTIPTLEVPDASGWRRLHLVGIGGAGMSGLALVLLARGLTISGSDLKESKAVDALRSAGARVFVGHGEANVPADADAVVRSTAVPAGNVEVRYAEASGIPVLIRAQVLAAIMHGARGVAVAGTHGKTTTTSMAGTILAAAGLAPTYVIGGDLNESGSGAVSGGGDVFVAEADESDGSFLLLRPEVAVVTNVEEDHLDFYSDLTEIEAAFRAFATGAGTVVAGWDSAGTRRALADRSSGLLRFGEHAEADLRVVDVELSAHASAATLQFHDARTRMWLPVPGRHNVLNAAAAVGATALLGVPVEGAVAALRSFAPVRRRFELRGSVRGTSFVDDYAHNPGKLAAVLRTARLQDPARLVAVFQPHRYSRTGAQWRQLGESLAEADVVVLTDVYAAGEDPIPGVTGKLLVEALAEARPGKRIVYLPHRTELAPFLAREARRGDLVLTLGAGDVTMVGEETIQRLGGTGGAG